MPPRNKTKKASSSSENSSSDEEPKVVITPKRIVITPAKIIKILPEVEKKPSTVKKTTVVKPTSTEKKPSTVKKTTVVKPNVKVEKKPSTVKKTTVVKPTTPKITKKKTQSSSDSEEEIIRKPPVSKLTKPKITKKKTQSSSNSEEEVTRKLPISKPIKPKMSSSSSSSSEDERKIVTPKIIIKKGVPVKPIRKQPEEEETTPIKPVSSVNRTLVKKNTLSVEEKGNNSKSTSKKSNKKQVISRSISDIPQTVMDKIYEYAGVKGQMRFFSLVKGAKNKDFEDRIINSSKVNLITQPLSADVVNGIIERYPDLRFEGLYLVLKPMDTIDWDMLGPIKSLFLKELRIDARHDILNLKLLTKFPNLISLHITGQPIHMESFSESKKLENLYVDYVYKNTKVEPLNLGDIGTISTLKTLTLSLSQLDIRGHILFKSLDESEKNKFTLNLSDLSALHNLTEVTINNFYIAPSAAFMEDDKLTTVTFNHCYFENLDFLCQDGSEITTLTILYPQKVFTIKQIGKLKKLTSFTIRYLINGNTDVLEPLADCTALTTIEVISSFEHDEGIPPMTLNFVDKLPSLISLHISGYIGSLEPLGNCRALKSLYIDTNYTSPRPGIYLPSVQGTYTGLTDLVLKNVNYTEGNDVTIGNHTLLTKLSIETKPLRKATKLDGLASLHNLVELDISYNYEVKDYSFLSGMTSLNKLTLSTIQDFKPLNTLKNLKHLEINSLNENFLKEVKDTASLEDMKGLSSLESLEIRHSQLTDISPLSKLKTLQKLVLGDFEKLVKFSLTHDMLKLQTIHLSNCSELTDLEGFEHCPNLTKLDLYTVNISNINAVANCPKLDVLSIQHVPRFGDISAVAKCTNLTEIQLADCRIFGIMPLLKCVKLKNIRLANIITIVLVEDLARLKEVTRLELNACYNIHDFVELVTQASPKMLIISPQDHYIRGGDIINAQKESKELKEIQARRRR